MSPEERKPKPIMHCTVSFTGEVGGAPQTWVAGEIVASDDPVLDAFPEFFAPLPLRHYANKPRVAPQLLAPEEVRS